MSEKRITEENRYAGLALAEEELVARVAWCYYHDGLTQNDIGERLGLPRLKISRLLEKGRQSGVIRVQINSRYEAVWRWKVNSSSVLASRLPAYCRRSILRR